MKYKLFTVADPSDSNKIGVADTVNVLPEINKRGQFCWRSRPGLGNSLGIDGQASVRPPHILPPLGNSLGIDGSGYDFSLDQPVARNDVYATDEDQPLTVAAPGVLVNDHDLDGDELTAVLVAGPAHGALTLNSDGSFVYTPAADYNGLDSFTYQANDGQHNSNIATVTITVNPGADPVGACLYDGTVFESVVAFPTWDVIDNVTGTYSCTPGPILSTRIRTFLTPGTMKTCIFIYNVTGFTSTVCNDSIYMRIFNDFVKLTETSTLCYCNVGSDRTSITFYAGYPAADCSPSANPQGTVNVECVKIIDRDWVSAGEEELSIYYP